MSADLLHMFWIPDLTVAHTVAVYAISLVAGWGLPRRPTVDDVLWTDGVNRPRPYLPAATFSRMGPGALINGVDWNHIPLGNSTSVMGTLNHLHVIWPRFCHFILFLSRSKFKLISSNIDRLYESWHWVPKRNCTHVGPVAKYLSFDFDCCFISL